MSPTALMRHLQAMAYLVGKEDSPAARIEYRVSEVPGYYDVTGSYEQYEPEAE